jgi:ABC-type polysaccharide/polyol phosphate export permease
MIDSAELIKKVRFPRQLVAFSMVAAQAVTFAVMLGILIVLSLAFIPGARGTVWLAIPLALAFAGFVAGCSLLVASLNVIFRDVEHILTAALLPWFFLTPILWSPSGLEGGGRKHHLVLEVLHWGNPVTPPIYAVRDALWLGHTPRLGDVVYLLLACAVALALAALVFRSVDDRIAVEL